MKKLIVFALAPLFAHAAALTPVDLRCDYIVNPLGVDSVPPRLFWKLQADGRNHRQTAYEILVASSAKMLAHDRADVWDSGKVLSDENIQVPFPERLNSFEQVFWKVRVWDEADKTSPWSDPATWTMGVLDAGGNDWHAQWIGAADTNIPSLLLRREFTVKSSLKRALVNICGLGQYELTLNGGKCGSNYLSPGWTKYDKTCLYDTRDLTAALKQGRNVVGVELGNGMYQVLGGGRFTKFKGSFGPQKVIAQIRLEYADGAVEFIGTDENWRTAAGPITFNSIYGGEDCDARAAQKGWNLPRFNDSNWSPAVPTTGPGGQLRGLSCAAPGLRFFETHAAVGHWTLTNGDCVYDLGQNAAHVPQVSLTGPAGSHVQLWPSELTNSDGSITQGSMGAGHRGAIWCEFTKATDGTETWSPKFFYVGCRYLQVHLTPATNSEVLPIIESISGRVLQSDSSPVGEFACSNDLFNRTRKIVRWAQRSNLESLLTDCPHRERLGWLEEDHLNGPSLRYEFDLAQLFTKSVNDMADSQLTNGLVPTTAPEYTIFRSKTDTNHLRNDFGDSPEWSASIILVPAQQYEFDGDLELFRRHYSAMKDYLAYLGSRTDHYLANFGLGDWYDIGPKKPGVSQLTPIALTATAFYFEDARVLAHAAELLGRADDAREFGALAENIRLAFNEKFFDAKNQTYATGSQCANAIPLVFGLCESSNRRAVLDTLVRDVRTRDHALTAGDVGYRYLIRALADGGRSDVLFDLNNQTNQPGYGMQLAKGKTSLTEAWDGGSSQNHFMLGQIEEWFYHDLAGIQSDGNGFKHIIIAPQPVGDITWVNCSYDSIRGRIVSNWKRARGNLVLDVTIPPNTTADVLLPAQSADSVSESGHPAMERDGIRFTGMQNDRAVLAIGSGQYHFEVPER